jgi:hypothetical protein
VRNTPLGTNFLKKNINSLNKKIIIHVIFWAFHREYVLLSTTSIATFKASSIYMPLLVVESI